MSKAGRPKVKLNEELLIRLARIGCTSSEIAAVVGCHPDTLRDNYSEVLDRGRDRGRMSLRRKQWKVAMSGNVAMLIWLGKQLLGQTEKIQAVDEDGDRPLEELSDEELMKRLKASRAQPRNP